MFFTRIFSSVCILASTVFLSSSAPTNITHENFKHEVLQSKLPVVLAYFSLAHDWDNNSPIYKSLAQERSLEQQKDACKIMLRIFLELAKDPDLKKYKFTLLDVDKEVDLALHNCQVAIVPSFELYKDGHSIGGFDSLELSSTDKEKIKALFKKYLAQLS